MASVTLTNLWLHEEANHEEYIQVANLASITERASRDTRVAQRAGGRRQIITRKSRIYTADVELGLVSRDVAEWIDDRKGDLLMLRDPRGRVWWGTVREANVVEVSGHNLVNVSFAFLRTTHDQEV